jgi:hypothetical protein
MKKMSDEKYQHLQMIHDRIDQILDLYADGDSYFDIQSPSWLESARQTMNDLKCDLELDDCYPIDDPDTSQVETLLRSMAASGTLNVDLTDEDIDSALKNAPPIQVSADLTERALKAMREAQQRRENGEV